MLYLGMKPSEKIYNDLIREWNAFELDYEKYLEFGNQAAARRARLSLIRLRKLVTPFRLISVAESQKKG